MGLFRKVTERAVMGDEYRLLERGTQGTAVILDVCRRCGPLRAHGEELPTARHPGQLMLAAIIEFKARSCDQVRKGPRNEDFTRSGSARDSGTDMYGNASDVIASNFELTGVQSRPHGHTDARQRVSDRECGPDALGGTIECREHAVAGRLHKTTAWGSTSRATMSS